MKFPHINSFDFQRITVNLMKFNRKKRTPIWSDLEYARAGLDPEEEFVKRVLRFCGLSEHSSDCAVHNEPAYPNGPCDCGLG